MFRMSGISSRNPRHTYNLKQIFLGFEAGAAACLAVKYRSPADVLRVAVRVVGGCSPNPKSRHGHIGKNVQDFTVEDKQYVCKPTVVGAACRYRRSFSADFTPIVLLASSFVCGHAKMYCLIITR
jgi:hypothetical protein